MNLELEEAIEDWNREVARETKKLIEGGTPPFEAAHRAAGIVSERRRERSRRGAAPQRTDE